MDHKLNYKNKNYKTCRRKPGENPLKPWDKQRILRYDTKTANH